MSAPTGLQTRPRSGLLAAAAVLMLAAAVQYLILEAVTAAAWTDPPYSYAANLVPDLGNTACGPYQDRIVCSPLNPVMNTAFVLQGLLFGAAAVLMSRLLQGRTRATLLVLGLVHAAGLTLTGSFPPSPDAIEDGTLFVNLAGAGLGLMAGNAILIVAGRQWRPLLLPSWLGPASVVVGAAAIAGGFLLFATAVPPGIRERLSIYPFILWQLIAGSALLAAGRPRGAR